MDHNKHEHHQQQEMDHGNMDHSKMHHDLAAVTELLAAAGLKHDAHSFKRIASSRSLYHWNADANQEY